jgi:hypothetical protein
MDIAQSEDAGVLFSLRNYLPRQYLLNLVSGFFNSKLSYMLDVITDPTGEERGSGIEDRILQRLQTKQNECRNKNMSAHQKGGSHWHRKTAVARKSAGA